MDRYYKATCTQLTQRGSFDLLSIISSRALEYNLEPRIRTPLGRFTTHVVLGLPPMFETFTWILVKIAFENILVH